MKEYRDGDRGFEVLGHPNNSALSQNGSAGAVTSYEFPGIKPSWLARRRGRKLGRALQEYAAGLVTARRYTAYPQMDEKLKELILLNKK